MHISRLSIVVTFPAQQDSEYFEEHTKYADVTSEDTTCATVIPYKAYLLEHLESNLGVELEIDTDEEDCYIHVHYVEKSLADFHTVMNEIFETLTTELELDDCQILCKGDLQEQVHIDLLEEQAPADNSHLN